MSKLKGLLRTHDCGELNKSNIGESVTLCGWNNKYRDLGGLHFVDIRDKFGMTQLAFDEYEGELGILKELSLESVIKATGVVRERPENARNKDMSTGEVEVSVKNLELLSYADNVPFLPLGKVDAQEDFKLKYRYLDLRTPRLQNILAIRSSAARDFREALYGHGFTEVETPVLYKSTPEGARDYIVPSRVHPGKVYALPQSPQTLKQLLMIGSTDKYFQLTKCFRDEDLRADRQPEFSQVDIEVSFATQEYIKNLTIDIIQKVYKLSKDFTIPTMSYKEAIDKYGSDKPDIRFGLAHHIVTDVFASSEFSLFSDMAKANGLIKMIYLSESEGTLARKDIDGLVDVVKPFGGKGVAWFKVTDNKVSGGISKFIKDTDLSELQKRVGDTGNGLFLFFAAPSHKVAHDCADVTRRHLARKLNLIGSENKFLWVNDFPLLDYDEEDGRFYACHHPFTQPHKDDLEKFMSGNIEDLKNIRADAYDLVINGYEAAGGSMRIYDQKVQKQMFKVLSFTDEEAEKQFGFFIEALQYGTPPHGGVAFGFDRNIMILAKTENIRDVIAFPKTNSAADLMSKSPSEPLSAQLDELCMKFTK